MVTPRDDTQHPAAPTSGWYLEGYRDGASCIVHIDHFPFTIGRHENSDLAIFEREVSRFHATLETGEHGLVVRDLGSTNGTFVNNRPIPAEHAVRDGDVLHFGRFEYRLRYNAEQTRDIEDDMDTTRFSAAPPQESDSHFVIKDRFEELLRTGAVQPYFQPLVAAQDFRLIGYELLGRGALEGLDKSPMRLLKIARGLGQAKECSTLFRETGILAAARRLPHSKMCIFFNILPEETELNFLRTAVPKMRELAPDLPLAMEIHEETVTHLKDLAEIKALLHDHAILLAFDDFGAGQALRFKDMCHVQPDVLKFDIAWIRDIDRETKVQQLASDLVNRAREFGIKTLAEGTETKAEVDTCVALGFDYLQGFYFGKPDPDLLVTTFRPAPAATGPS